MPRIHPLAGYLDGLRRELKGAETLGKSTVADIKAEIRRVEGLMGVDSKAADPKVETAVAAAPTERAVRKTAAK